MSTTKRVPEGVPTNTAGAAPADTSRVPRGVPTGGQFAASAKTEAGVVLDDSEVVAPASGLLAHDKYGQCPDCTEEYHGTSTPEVLLCERHDNMAHLPFNSDWHTDEPLERLSLSAENRMVTEMIRQVADGHMSIDTPYQRGSVWSEDQQRGLVKSMLSGVPVPALIINDRGTGAWSDANGGYPAEGEPWAAVVDGRQRIEALAAFFDGRVPVPASWFASDDVVEPMESGDGHQWVTFNGLAPRARARCENRFALPVARSQAASITDEAALYLLVNGSGTAQTEADMDNARQVAGQ